MAATGRGGSIPAPPIHEVRERLAIPSSRLAEATRSLLHQPGIREGLILSTCNRVELITLQDETGDSAEASGGMKDARTAGRYYKGVAVFTSDEAWRKSG